MIHLFNIIHVYTFAVASDVYPTRKGGHKCVYKNLVQAISDRNCSYKMKHSINFQNNLLLSKISSHIFFIDFHMIFDLLYTKAPQTLAKRKEQVMLLMLFGQRWIQTQMRHSFGVSKCPNPEKFGIVCISMIQKCKLSPQYSIITHASPRRKVFEFSILFDHDKLTFDYNANSLIATILKTFQ